MIKISKKKHLEMILENVPSHPNPKVELEQYSTPATIAADLLWNAYSLGDIGGKNILDTACGTGILAIASSFMGGKKVLGLDIDEESIDLARKTILKMDDNRLNNLNFISADILNYGGILDFFKKNNHSELFYSTLNDFSSSFNSKFDTLIQNPPFGSQERAERGIDKKFIEFSMNSANVIYSFHMASTEEFIIDYFRDLGGDVTHKLVYKFRIPKIYDFHTKDYNDVKIIVLRVENFD